MMGGLSVESSVLMKTKNSEFIKLLNLEKSFIKNKCFLFMEMGLDPGIDHMSAMKIINDLKKDSQILEFESYTGGLIKDHYKKNPWGYKFTWNPSNVVLAGIDNARYIEKGRLKFIPYNNLFKDHKEIIINNVDTLKRNKIRIQRSANL